MNIITRMYFFAYGLVFAINVFAANASAQNFKKVVWVVFENTNYQKALKQPDFANLTKYGALLTNMTALTHPSQGNYISMVAGATLGVKDDKSINLNATHVGDLLEKVGRDWQRLRRIKRKKAFPATGWFGLGSSCSDVIPANNSYVALL